MLVVIKNGRARFVYDDGLHAALSRLGAVKIARASQVEFDHEKKGWTADMSLTSPGVVLGPFESRTAALEEERVWLEAQLVADSVREHQDV